MGAKTIVPADNDELLEMLNDGPRMAAMFKAGAAGDVAPFQQWIKDYSRTFNKNDPSIHEQNADAQQKFMIEWLRQNENAGIRNANLNMNTNVNVNANPSGANINASTAPSTFAAKEPETYKATLVFSAETEGGDKAIGIPQLSAEVAKSGSDRRL